MPSVSELAGSSGSGLTTQIDSKAAQTAALTLASMEAVRIALTTGINANNKNPAIPTTPAFASHHR
jgi:hypothetical protein